MGVFDRHLNKHKRTTATTMSLDTYTRYIPLTQKAQFWGTYVSALKGSADLCAAPEPRLTHHYPSITETLPPAYPGFRHEFGKLENLMWRGRGRTLPRPHASSQRLMIGSTALGTTTYLFKLTSMDLTGTEMLGEDSTNTA